jgi:arylsulfatase A-like enzyme
MYPKEKLALPKLRKDESQGQPAVIAKERTGLAREILSSGLLRQGVQTYLAAISHQDAQIGRVLAALRASPHFDNTIVILWSDQGFHLGEKNQWGKSTLWRETTHVPFIIAGPGIAPGKSDRCVGLVDVYPTVSALCGLNAPTGLAGRSLVPLLRQPAAAWDYPVVTSRSPTRHAVRTSQWCYIRYVTANGVGEELYDRVKDPSEWHNLANESAHQATKSRMLAMLPSMAAAHLVSPESIGRTDVD